jgi:uncharacterized cupredoxin-like copper-binding protein
MVARWKVSLVLIGLALAALPGQASAQQDVTISELEFRLDPNSLNATTGQAVHFTVRNVGTIDHNLEVELESARIEKQLFDTNLRPGETRTVDFTFTQAGKWEMYCPIDNHKQRGMMGDVNVLAVGAPAPAPAAPAAPAAPPAAAPVSAPPPAPRAAPAAPAQLPRTGGGPLTPLAVALGGLALLGGGLLVRRRQ